MPQVDLETLVSACGLGGERKIACETIADEPTDLGTPDSAGVNIPPDVPPESFWLSKDAEFDWFDRNAFLDRKESIKRNSNSMNLNPNMNPSNSNSKSNSVYLRSKAAIIGLPNTQKTNYVDSKRRNCRLAKILLFPKRLDSMGKVTTEIPVTEPSSPKVSCLGTVTSKRCRCLRKLNGPAPEQGKLVSQQANTGFLSLITSFFRSVHHRRTRMKRSPEVDESSEDSAPGRSSVTLTSESPASPPALGGVMRLTSGRRLESWGGAQVVDVAGHDSSSSRTGECMFSAATHSSAIC